MLSFRHTRNFIRKHCAAIGKGDFRHCRNYRNTFCRCRHKSISQLLKRGTYHANATASRYTSDPFRHWNPASDHSADSGTDRNRSQLSGLYGGLQGRRTKRILSPAERVLQQDGSLLAADEEAFQRQMQGFIWGYQKQMQFRQFSESCNSISNVQGVFAGNGTRYIAMNCQNRARHSTNS